jgi:hypothetical protein
MKRVAGDGKSLFRKLVVLFETASHCLVLRYINADSETVSCRAEYNN